jgi:chromosome segregation protein
MLERDEDEFKREVSEGVALIGRRVNEYKDGIGDDGAKEDREAQRTRHRELEKLKVRLEELGGTNAEDITKEYEETKERDAFLARELDDLEASAQSLRDLIAELENELDQRFADGVEAIGVQFDEYFKLMFGGGSAKLKVERHKKRNKLATALFGENEPPEDGDTDEPNDLGVDIEVALPRKRVQNLMVLSGGERALTSIALIFAMSQVNPPPFLILDETDAALDEANSRRYGDLITKLSEKSQLILITHNRETMSRAGVLYGITMGADGVSRILSVKFDEAAAVAK